MKKILLFLSLFIPIGVGAIDTSARSAILMDMDSNRDLYEENINDKKIKNKLYDLFKLIEIHK